MIRTALIAAAASLALAGPALADGKWAKFTSKLDASAQQTKIYGILAARGYVATSEFTRIGTGHWVGTATKDGKAQRVALKLPPREATEFFTN